MDQAGHHALHAEKHRHVWCSSLPECYLCEWGVWWWAGGAAPRLEVCDGWWPVRDLDQNPFTQDGQVRPELEVQYITKRNVRHLLLRQLLLWSMLTLNITPTLTLTLILILILTLPWTKNPIITLTFITGAIVAGANVGSPPKRKYTSMFWLVRGILANCLLPCT